MSGVEDRPKKTLINRVTPDRADSWTI